MSCPSAISHGGAGAAMRLQGGCSCGGWRGRVSSELRVGRKLAQTAAFPEGSADRAATAEKEEGFVQSSPPPTHGRSCWDDCEGGGSWKPHCDLRLSLCSSKVAEPASGLGWAGLYSPGAAPPGPRMIEEAPSSFSPTPWPFSAADLSGDVFFFVSTIESRSVSNKHLVRTQCGSHKGSKSSLYSWRN